MELYRKYRPQQLKEVLGQDHITKPLLRLIKSKTLPHAIMFTGPSGCGKTTIARIVKNKMKCGEHDYKEINAAKSRGIDEIRDMDRGTNCAALQEDGTRFWLFDEAHKLTNDAQNAMLKVLEDPPDHAYIILCTTNPNKLITTVKNRCTEYAVKLLKEELIQQLVESVAIKEGSEICDKVSNHIAKHCGGSARKALVILEKVLAWGEDIGKQMDSVLEAQLEEESFALVKMLLWEKATFGKVSAFLKKFKEDGSDVESIRHLILACANTELLKNNGNRNRAYNVIMAFRDAYYECGFAGLTASCFEVVEPQR